ncbi:glutamate-1-semialdehyde-2,1-aminomutase [Sesbania bispinosa]|nr:glutamate-1-semialdehyde-2,1-aminomutase [Sesbania bispinosa]
MVQRVFSQIGESQRRNQRPTKPNTLPSPNVHCWVAMKRKSGHGREVRTVLGRREAEDGSEFWSRRGGTDNAAGSLVLTGEEAYSAAVRMARPYIGEEGVLDFKGADLQI